MIELDFRGDTHPKQAVLITDDKDGELANIEDLVGELAEDDSDEFVQLVQNWKQTDGTQWELEIPHDSVGEFLDIIAVEYFHLEEALETENQKIMDEAGF